MKKSIINPLVSVIVPVFNAELYISQCIKSILAQVYKNIEVIIIDDGSFDQSREILDNFALSDKRIRVIHKHNEGVSKTRNIGIAIAKGEYVTFVDADDTLNRNAIKIMVSLIEGWNADVVRTNYISFRSGIKKQRSIQLAEKLYENDEIIDLIKKVIMGEIQGYTWLLLIRIDILRKYNIYFDNSISMMEDTKFYVNLFNVCRSIYLSDTVTYNYMINTTSASRSIHNYRRNANDIIVLNNYFKSQFSKKISNLDAQLDADHAVFMTSQIAIAVEYPNHAYKLAIANVAWLSTNKSFIELYNNGDFSSASKYSRLVIFFVKRGLVVPSLVLFVIRGIIKRFI